jgi:hypothetical protein
MTKKFTLSVFATFVFAIACATAAQAQAQRTFVAGPGIGLDTNNTVGQGFCSFTNPCRNFSVAFAVTNTGGEIIAVSPGVGYGGLSINKAITVTGLPGQVAFVAIGASTTGFSVAAGATEQVLIKNITFNGSGAAGSTGLSHTSGKLILENCTFTQLTTGVLVTGAKADLIDCKLSKNTTALRTNGTGCDPNVSDCTGGGGTTQVRIAYGHVNNNGTAFQQDNPGFGICTPGPFTCPPTPFPTRIAIFVFGTGGQAATNVTGNTVMATGTGTGCGAPGACQNITVYSFNAASVNP